MTIIKTNKQKANKLKTNKKQTSENKQINKAKNEKKNGQLKSYTIVYYICICLKRFIRMDMSTFVEQYYVCFK
jgi:hypothetical protein